VSFNSKVLFKRRHLLLGVLEKVLDKAGKDYLWDLKELRACMNDLLPVTYFLVSYHFDYFVFKVQKSFVITRVSGKGKRFVYSFRKKVVKKLVGSRVLNDKELCFLRECLSVDNWNLKCSLISKKLGLPVSTVHDMKKRLLVFVVLSVVFKEDLGGILVRTRGCKK